MKFLRTARIAFMMLAPALMLGIGAGFSNFFFGNTVSNTSNVDPSIENIRDNFHFDEPEDTNLFNTKFYDVTFYSQAVSGSDPYYSYNGGYHKELGYFALSETQFRNLQALGAELYQITNNSAQQVTDPSLVNTKIPSDSGTGYLYVLNHITFRKISTITPEVASALLNPLCDLFDKHYTDDDRKYYPLEFATWTLTSFTSIYSGMGVEGNIPTWADGYFPATVDDTPNFNFLLSEQPGLDDPDSEEISFFPIFSSGKDYTSEGNTQDSISISEYGFDDSNDFAAKTNLLDTDLNVFMPDSVSQGILIDVVGNYDSSYQDISAYRFAGLEVYENADLVISSDFDRYNGSWGGDSLIVQTQDHYVDWHSFEHYFDYNHETGIINENQVSFSLSEGRYNLYLFVKERWALDSEKGYEEGSFVTTYRYSNCVDPNSSFDFSTDVEEKNLIGGLKDLGIETFNSFSFGSTTLYTCSDGRNAIWGNSFPQSDQYSPDGFYRQTFDYRDYFLVVEKMYSPKLLGGTNGWNYSSESSSDPLFLQSPNHRNEYETRSISLSEDVTHAYDLGNGYSLSLPGTCFSVGLSETTTTVRLPVINYSENLVPSTISVGGNDTAVTEAVIDENTGEILEPGNLPISVIRDRTTGKYRFDYYFSKNGTNSNPSDGLMTLYDAISSESANNSLLEKIYVSGGSGKYNGPLSSAPNEIISEIQNHNNIIVAPHEGQYNIYLKYEFQGSDPVIDLYAYRIKDLTVRIFDPGDLDSNGVIDGKDVVYREDGFVMTENGTYDVYQKSYLDQNGSEYSLWTICSDGSHGNTTSMDVDYIYLADDFVSGDSLKLDTVFTRRLVGSSATDVEQISLLEKMNLLWGEGKVLVDIVSGEYVTPTVVQKGDYAINKNTVLLAIYRPNDYADGIYGDLFSGYDVSTEREVSL